jgi:hypothetical protein
MTWFHGLRGKLIVNYIVLYIDSCTKKPPPHQVKRY